MSSDHPPPVKEPDAPGLPQSVWRYCAAGLGAEPIIEHGKTGMLMVLVPGGKFLAGGEEFEVELPGYYVGMHAVTNGQYGAFVGETKHRAPNNGIWQEAGKAEHPVTDVSWDDAQAYCGWAGLRLPGELEWEKAARGVDGRKHPWGDAWYVTKCRHSGNKGSETTAGVWSYAEGASPWGALQMSGNVWEWCEDWYEEQAYHRYKRADLTPPKSGQYRVVRGGSWFYAGPDLFAASNRSRNVPDLGHSTYGFRCVLSAAVSP